VTASGPPADHVPIPPGDLAIGAAFVVIALAVWIFPRYSYEISGSMLKVRRRIFGWIPLGWYRVRLSEIVRVEPSRLGGMGFGVLAWGSLLKLRGLLLELRTPRHLFWDAIYISPPDPEAFAALLGRKLPSDAVVLSKPAWAERRAWPLWATDAAVVAAALCFCAWVPIVAYADPLSEKIGLVKAVTLAVALSAVILPVHFWFWSEALRSAAEHSSFGRWVWFLIVGAFPGAAAVVYYVFQWRPRRVGRTIAGDSTTGVRTE